MKMVYIFFNYQIHNPIAVDIGRCVRALRLFHIIPISAIVFFLYLWMFSSIVRMVIRNGRTIAPNDFDLYLNKIHFDLPFLKSLQEKTEYKTPADEPPRKSTLKVNNGGTDMPESLNQSRFHPVSLASAGRPSVSPTLPPNQHANDTTFPLQPPLPPNQHANGTTFPLPPPLSTTAIPADEPLRKSNLKVNNGGTDMPESPNQNRFHLISLASAHRPSIPPTPPSTTAIPRPPTQQQIQEQQLKNIVEALIGAADFAGWANLLSSADLSSLPLTATFFIPGNDAMTNLQTRGDHDLDPFLIAYHIIPQRLSFSDLQQFKPNTRIPTLLPSKFIVITNNSLSNFTIDGSQITYPDLYANSAFTVHGVDKVLEYSVYGAEDPLFSPPVTSPPQNNTVPDAVPSPPLKPKSVSPSFFPAGGRGFIDGRKSSSSTSYSLSIEKLMIISVFCYSENIWAVMF